TRQDRLTRNRSGPVELDDMRQHERGRVSVHDPGEWAEMMPDRVREPADDVQRAVGRHPCGELALLSSIGLPVITDTRRKVLPEHLQCSDTECVIEFSVPEREEPFD